MKTALATTRFGRVLLHLACLACRPDHLAWHWAGIRRELWCAI
jgi:hypothetical protein